MRSAVALFTYNRPRHTAAVLAALARNHSLDRVDVVIFQDGLRAGHEAGPHREVAALVEGATFCARRIVRRERNLGLADSIIDGVSGLLDEYDAVAVLEDDCVPSSRFVEYTTWCLERFAGAPEVFAISGYALPSLPREYAYDLCYAPLPSSWGWATWRDRWARFDARADGWQALLDDPRRRRAFEAPGTLFSTMLRQQMTGQLSSWAIRWYYSVFRAGGVCVYPLRSYIRNIGMDGTGEHEVRTTRLDVELCERFDGERLRLPPDVTFDPAIRRAFREKYDLFSTETALRVLRHPSTWPRVARQLWNMVRR